MLNSFKRWVRGLAHRSVAARSANSSLRLSHRPKLALEALEPRHLLDAGPLVSEFLAINNGVLQDEDGQYSDWIEIHNPTPAPVDLAGWHLTDDPAALEKWTFPEMTLAPDEYLVVFASDKNRTDPAGELHANFKLSGGGEYLALVRPDGVTVSHDYAPAFPPQTADVSYGLIGEQESPSATRPPARRTLCS